MSSSNKAPEKAAFLEEDQDVEMKDEEEDVKKKDSVKKEGAAGLKTEVKNEKGMFGD